MISCSLIIGKITLLDVYRGVHDLVWIGYWLNQNTNLYGF